MSNEHSLLQSETEICGQILSLFLTFKLLHFSKAETHFFHLKMKSADVIRLVFVSFFLFCLKQFDIFDIFYVHFFAGIKISLLQMNYFSVAIFEMHKLAKNCPRIIICKNRLRPINCYF